MAATKYRLEGADRLSKTLKDAGTSLEDMKSLHAEVGNLVAESARPNMPVKSGRLAGTVRASGTKSAGVVRAGSASVPYAGVQEFGWPDRNIPAQPALTDALAATEPTILDRYQDAVDKVLGKVKGQ